MPYMADSSRFIDITLPFSSSLAVWPGDAPVEIHHAAGVPMVSTLRMSSHSGTHVDAPAHFFPQGRAIDRLPLETLIGRAYVADVAAESIITASSLEAARIPAGVTRLLLKTRRVESWSRTTQKPLLMERRKPGQRKPFDEAFLGLDVGAAGWLLARQIRLVGINTPSIDPFAATACPAHHALLSNEVIIVENLHLENVKPGFYRLICLPLPVENGDGAPARAALEIID